MKLKIRGVKLAINRAQDADLNIVLLDPKTLILKGFLDEKIEEKSINRY